MSFPQTYKNKIELLETKIKGEKLSVFSLYSWVSEKVISSASEFHEGHKQRIFFSLKNKIFRYSYDVQIRFKKKGSDFDILYEIDMDRVIRVILTGIILFALLSFLSVKIFLTVSGIFTFLFYQLNLLMNIYSVEQLIREAVGDNRYAFHSKEVLSEEQIEWMKQKDRCSGCGEFLSLTDVFCPECGLRVRSGKVYNPYNISKYNDKKVIYHLKNNS